MSGSIGDFQSLGWKAVGTEEHDACYAEHVPHDPSESPGRTSSHDFLGCPVLLCVARINQQAGLLAWYGVVNKLPSVTAKADGPSYIIL